MARIPRYGCPAAVISLAFFGLLIFGYFFFSPGLPGPLLIDDNVHLPKLSGSGTGIDSFSEVLNLGFPITGGSPRTLSYLSLLINDNNWPSDPSGFRRTNLLLHLINVVLVFAFSRQLISIYRREPQASTTSTWLALLAATLWMIHPLQLSPIYLIVQRMTLLGATFSLLALISYINARRQALNHPRRALVLLTLAFGAFLSLGVFAKEIAISVVFYVLVLEATLLRRCDVPRPTWWKPWAAVYIAGPLLLLAIYATRIFADQANAYAIRDFDLAQRLLSEARVLFTYLKVILVPTPAATGPFHDGFVSSSSLFAPPTTFWAVLGLTGLLASALYARKRAPLYAFPILWFLAGHLLEGSVIPLELYFEHRNYLSMLGIVIALTLTPVIAPKQMRPLIAAGLLAYVGLAFLVTMSSTHIWGSKPLIAEIWSKENPLSARAQTVAISYYAEIGAEDKLQQTLDTAQRSDPRNASYELLRITLELCNTKSPPVLDASVDRFLVLAPTAKFDFNSIEILRWLLRDGKLETCSLKLQDVEAMLDALISNPKFTKRGLNANALYHLKADISKKQGDLDGTIRALRMAYQAIPYYETTLNQAYFLFTAGLLDEAEEAIDLAEASPKLSLGETLTRQRRIANYRRMLEKLRSRQEDGDLAAPIPTEPMK